MASAYVSYMYKARVIVASGSDQKLRSIRSDSCGEAVPASAVFSPPQPLVDILMASEFGKSQQGHKVYS